MFQPENTLSVHNATAVLAAGLEAMRAGQTEFDLGQLTQVDSSAVAVLLAWQREANDRHLTLHIVNLPPSLQSLANLYGVAQLLPL